MEIYSGKWKKEWDYPHKQEQDDLEKMSKAELIAEIKRLRAIIEELKMRQANIPVICFPTQRILKIKKDPIIVNLPTH